MDPNVLQFLAVTGAAGAFFLVLKWIVDGKLHPDSEVQGLKEDKVEQGQTIAALTEALKESNAADQATKDLLLKILERLGGTNVVPH